MQGIGGKPCGGEEEKDGGGDGGQDLFHGLSLSLGGPSTICAPWQFMPWKFKSQSAEIVGFILSDGYMD